ncbi:zinc finger protein OZF-like isoform X1 [Vanessa tameamea]|uniref:Zinc finger protein OZF-like isoform X1 n=1 Tax=Vanessa tameamea TaxID=334116 RepID=A0A8B8IJ51_VANTA|nr:zinc finger protein OZF-like isoform X1 [Vanessa tameamea]
MPDFNKLCRACLTTMDSFKYKFNDNVSTDDYLFCTAIEINQDEEFPKTLCNTCYDLLTKFTEFKRTCIKSQRILLTFRPIKEEVINKIEEVEQKTNDCNDEIENWTFDDGSLDNGPLQIHFTENECSNELIIKVEEEEPKGKNENVFVTTAFADATRNSTDNNRVEIPKQRNKLTCKFCNKEFYHRNMFDLHMSVHTRTLTLKCNQCTKTFVSWSGLKRHHTNWHSLFSLRSVTCRTCGKIATSPETLLAHKKLHKKRKLFICNVCGKSYTTTNNLHAHLETHKENRERQYTCEHCGKKFYTKKCILSHFSRCHTGRKFICQICSYPFTDKYNLSKHLQSHEGRKCFKCQICGKSFATRQISVEHQRIHSGERPYSCTYCTKTFISKKRLTEHLRTHTGEKPHKCFVCDHSFTQRGTLTRHMKIHTKSLIN